MISFRYCQFIDEESLEELAILIEKLESEGVNVLLTGMYLVLLRKMERIPFFVNKKKDNPTSMSKIRIA